MCELARSALFVPLWIGLNVGVRLTSWALAPVYALNNYGREEAAAGGVPTEELDRIVDELRDYYGQQDIETLTVVENYDLTDEQLDYVLDRL